MNRDSVERPSALDALKNGQTELQRVREHIGNKDPNKGTFEFSAYKADEIKARLQDLFHGKCAYCETFYSASAPVDVEHFRPKGAVSEEKSHPGYWWVATQWENLLPSCIDCNRRRKQKVLDPSQHIKLSQLVSRTADRTHLHDLTTGKKDSFPLASGSVRRLPEDLDFAAEGALLLNPCADDPAEFLQFNIDLSVGPALLFTKDPEGLPPRGNTSIHVYGLNRLRLVQDRTRLIRRLDFLAELSLGLSEVAEEIERYSETIQEASLHMANAASKISYLRDRILIEIKDAAEPSAPYSAMVEQWISRFMARIQES